MPQTRAEQEDSNDQSANRSNKNNGSGKILGVPCQRMDLGLVKVNQSLQGGINSLCDENQCNRDSKNQPFELSQLKEYGQPDRYRRCQQMNPEIPLSGH